MLVFTLFIFLLSSSQAIRRQSRNHVREHMPLQDIFIQQRLNDIIDHNYEEDEDGDDEEDVYEQHRFREVLKEINKDVLERAKRQNDKKHSRIKPYENYNSDQNQEFHHANKLKTTYEDVINKQHEKKNKDSVKKTDVLENRKHDEPVKDKTDTKKDGIVKKENTYTGILKVVHDINPAKKSIIANKDNIQVASVKVDDTVERQQALVEKVDPKEVFLEAAASTNNTGNKTKGPTHAHAKAPHIHVTSNKRNKDGLDNVSLVAVIAGCCVAGLAGICLAGYCWHKLHQESKYLHETQVGILTKENKSSRKGSGKKANPEDEKLAESAEVFHYLHAKKQMQRMEEPLKKSDKFSADELSDEEDEDTVYECPGLAPPGDMKVVNPLFSDAESHTSDKQSDMQSLTATPTTTEIESVDIKPPTG